MVYKRFKTVIIMAVVVALCMTGCQISSPGEETEAAYMKISAEDAKEIMDSTRSC